MQHDYLTSESHGQTHIDQPVLVSAGVVSAYPEIIRCDVFRVYGEREGVAWIGGRQALVSQRYPGYDSSFEWVFSQWSDL